MTNLSENDAFISQCHDYFDGAMSEAEKTAFMELLQSNPDKQSQFETIQKTIDRFVTEVNNVEVPGGLEVNIVQRIGNEPAHRTVVSIKSAKQPLPLWQLGAVAAALIGLLVWIGTSQFNFSGPSGNPPGVENIASNPIPANTPTTTMTASPGWSDEVAEEKLDELWVTLIEEPYDPMADTNDTLGWTDELGDFGF